MEAKIMNLKQYDMRRYDIVSTVYDEPNDIPALAYWLLKQAPLGMPMSRLALILGYAPNDFKRTWALLRGDLVKRYKAHIVSARQHGMPSLVAIENPVWQAAMKLLKMRREAQSNGVLPKPHYKKYTGDVVRVDFSQVWLYGALGYAANHDIFTVAEVYQYLGRSRSSTRTLLLNMVELKYLKKVSQGIRGRGKASRFSIADKGIDMIKVSL